MISLNEAQNLVRTLEHRWDAYRRNGWYLPKFKSAMITNEYLDKVSSISSNPCKAKLGTSVCTFLNLFLPDYFQIRNKIIWCPRSYEDARWSNGKLAVLKICPTPPPKLVLVKMLIDEAEKQKLDLGLDEMRPPDVEWMLVALATMKPGHRIFAKDYCY